MARRVWAVVLALAMLAAVAGGPVGTAAAARLAQKGQDVSFVPAAETSSPWANLIGPAFVRFVPGTQDWDLEFGVVGDGWGSTQPTLVSVEVMLDGGICGASQVSFADASWKPAQGKLTQAEVVELADATTAEARGLHVPSLDSPQSESRMAILSGLLAQAAPATLSLKHMDAVCAGTHSLRLGLTYEVGGQAVTLSSETTVLLAPLPPTGGWYPADLHMHSDWSDGGVTILALRASLAIRGYTIGYVTDHSESLRTKFAFPSMSGLYPTQCDSWSGENVWLFPGAELAVLPNGHALAYGLLSTEGLMDYKLSPQAGLDAILANSPVASACIAHPELVRTALGYTIDYSWDATEVVGYRGIELMSGSQASFAVEGSVAQFWLAQCERLRNWAGTLGASPPFLPSVRTGSDNHGPFWQDYVTYVQVEGSPSVWETRLAAVDSALRHGRTVVSQKGSLAYITLNGLPVGSTLDLASSNLQTFAISFRPVVAGSYGLTLYRDNCAQQVWSTGVSTQAAGAPFSWTTSCPALAGRHYYWLYVEGADYCYTTPIYVTASSPEPRGSARIDNCLATPATVTPGQQVTFDLWFTNTGTTTKTFPISLYLYPPQGTAFEVDCPQIPVAPGNQGHATWSYTVPQGSTGSWDALYTIWNEPEQNVVVANSGRLENHFTVEASPPPSGSLRIDGHLVSPTTTTVGQTISFDLYYHNTGSAGASYAVSLSLLGPQGQAIDLGCFQETLAPSTQGHRHWTFTSCESQEGNWAAQYTIWTDASRASPIASTGWLSPYFTILPAPPPTATMRVDHHWVSPTSTPSGQMVTFNFYCTNTGTTTLPHAVSLTLLNPRGQIIELDCQTGTLAPGTQGRYIWTFTSSQGQEGSWAANYTVWSDTSRSTQITSTGWQNAYFTIQPGQAPTRFRFDSHRAFPTFTCTGHIMFFELFCTNTGPTQADFAVTLTVRSPSGQTMDLPPCFWGNLAAGAQGYYDWSLTPAMLEAGSWDAMYAIWVDGSKTTCLANTGWLPGYFTVLATPPPTTISIDSHRPYPAVGHGEIVCFDLYCTNTGIVTESFVASLALRGPSGQLVELFPYTARPLPGVRVYSFWTYSPAGQYGDWDAKYTLWTDMSRTTPLATTGWLDGYFTVLPPEPPSPPSARIDSFAATPRTLEVGHPVSFEMWFTNNGAVTWTYVAALTLTSPSGQVVRVLPDQELRVGPNNQGQTLWTYAPTEAGKWDVLFEVWKDTAHTVLLASPGVQPDYLTVTNRLVISEPGGSTAVTEGGLGDTYTVALAGQPAGPVTITLAGDKVTALSATGSSTVIFGPGNWDVPQTVFVTAIDDATVEGPHSGTVRHTASAGSGIPEVSLTVSITDNDAPTIVLAETGGSTAVTEGGASDTYTVRLGAQPSGPVTVTAVADSQVIVTSSLGGNTLSFSSANWSTPQTFTVRAVEDTLLEGPHFGLISHTAAGGGYAGAPTAILAVSVTDNDRPPTPGTLTATPSPDGVRLSWLAPSGGPTPSGYEVYVKASSIGTATKVKDVTSWSGASPNCEVTALDFAGTGFAFTRGLTYYFQVAAYVDLAGGTRVISLPSNAASAVAGPVPPLAARSLTAATTADGVRLGWLAPLTGVIPQGYDVYVATTSTGPFTTLAKTLTSWDGASPNCEVTALDFTGGSFTFTGGRTYYFQVKGFYVHPIAGKMVSPASNTASAVAGPTPPLAPASLTAAASATGIHLGWAAPTSGVPPQGYDVFIAAASTGPWTPVKAVTSWSGTAPNCEVTVLDFAGGGPAFTFTAGRAYYFRVYSYIVHPIAGKLTSASAASTSAMAGPAAPGAPTYPTATTTATGPATGIHLAWKPPTNAATIPPAGYSVWISASSAGAYTFVKDITGWTGTDPNCDITVLDFNGPGEPVFAFKGGIKYYLKVHSYLLNPLDGSRVSSTGAASAYATAGPTAPGAPTYPTATTTATGPATGIHLGWKPPANAATIPPAGYSVWISASSTGAYTFVKDVTSWTGTDPNCDVTVLDFNGPGQPVFAFNGGTRYYFRVFAYIAHPLDGSRVSSTTPASAYATAGPTAPGAPTYPTATTTATGPATGIHLAWKPPTNAATIPPAGYSVWISASSARAYTFVKDVTSWTGTDPNCDVTVLDFNGPGQPVFAFNGGTRYYFRVFAYIAHPLDGSRVSSATPASAYATAGPTPPGAPTSATAATAPLGVALNWRAPTNAATVPPAGYSVWISTSSTGAYTFVKDVTTWDGTYPNATVTAEDLDGDDLGGGVTEPIFTLNGGARYYFRIYAYVVHALDGSHVASTTAASVYATAGPLPPNAPASPVGATAADGFTLRWTPPTTGTAPTGYRIELSPSSTSGFVLLPDLVWSGPGPSIAVTGADIAAAGLVYTPGATYYARIHSFAPHPVSGEPLVSVAYASASAVAGPTPPNQPSYPTGSTNPAASGGGVKLGWRAPSLGATPAGYQVWASRSSSSGFVLVKDVTTWSGTYPNCLVVAADFTAAGLTMTPGARHYFRIYSYTLHPASGAPVLSLRYGSAYAVAG